MAGRSELILTTVDGSMMIATPVGRDLYHVVLDGKPMPSPLSRQGIRRLVSARRRRPIIGLSAEDHGVIPSVTEVSIPTRFGFRSGSCGSVIGHPREPDRVIKVVLLPDRPLSSIRAQENRDNLDPWRPYIGSSILAANLAQAEVFRELSESGSPRSLPEVFDYREGRIHNDDIEAISVINPDMSRVLRPGMRVAPWIMERIPDDPKPDVVARDTARRQILDYLFSEHGMIARDLSSDDNWGRRNDGSAVLLDPLVVPVEWLGEIPPTLHGIRNLLARARRNDIDNYVATLAPFGANLLDAEEAVVIALLSTQIAYRTPDPAFDSILTEYLGGRNLPYPRRSYLGYEHGMRPFHD